MADYKFNPEKWIKSGGTFENGIAWTSDGFGVDQNSKRYYRGADGQPVPLKVSYGKAGPVIDAAQAKSLGISPKIAGSGLRSLSGAFDRTPSKLAGLVDTPIAHIKAIGEGFKDNPLQALFGVDPLGAKIGSAVTGTQMNPLTNLFGGPTEGQFADFERQGINTGFARPLSKVADTIAGFYGLQGLSGLAGSAIGAPATGAGFGPAAAPETGIAGMQFPIGTGGAQGSNMGLGDIFGSIFGGGSGGGGGGFLGGLGDFLGSDTFSNITDLLGAGLQGYGAYQGYQAGRDMQNTQQNILRGLQGTNLGPFAGMGLGGVGGGFDPSTGTSTFGGGELDPLRQLLTLYATGSVPGIGQGVPGNVQGAAGQGNLPGYADSALIQAFGGLNPALENLNTAGGAGFGDVYNRTLSNLRQQAQPFETQALNALNENQFATGRAGTTGGALQTEAFARGLGQADLSRQLTATGEARTNLSLADQLAQSAFGRFGSSAGLSAGLNTENFGRQLSLAQLPNLLQAGQIGNVNQAIAGQGNINNQSLQNFLAALQAVSAQANARIGAGSNVAGFAGGPNFGTAALAPAAGLSQIGTAIGGMSGNPGGSIFDVLGRVLGNGGGNAGGLITPDMAKCLQNPASCR